MECNCIKCNATFNVDTKEHKESNLIVTDFKCSKCKQRYISYVKDKEVNKKITKLNNLIKLFKLAKRKTTQEEYANKIDKQHKIIKNDMNRLKIEYLKEHKDCM